MSKKEEKELEEAQKEALQSVTYVDVKPSDKKAYNTIGSIMQDILLGENNIQITNEMVAMTVLVQGIRSVFQYLSENRSATDDVTVDLGNYISITLENRVSEDEEKNGNFVFSAQFGEKSKIFSKSDTVTESE